MLFSCSLGLSISILSCGHQLHGYCYRPDPNPKPEPNRTKPECILQFLPGNTENISVPSHI